MGKKHLFVAITVLILSVMACKNHKEYVDTEFFSMEDHRKLAFSEWIESYNHDEHTMKRVYFKSSFEIEDANKIPEKVLNYLNQYPNLPASIKKEIVKGDIVPLMSIYEVSLSRPQLFEDPYIIKIGTRNPNSCIIGHKDYFNSEMQTFTSGYIIEFRYGFLWYEGNI